MHIDKCPHCGMIHETTCPRIKAINYDDSGRVKRVEFHPPAVTVSSGDAGTYTLDGKKCVE